jgi:hypothetical protein
LAELQREAQAAWREAGDLETLLRSLEKVADESMGMGCREGQRCKFKECLVETLKRIDRLERELGWERLGKSGL